MGVTNDREPYVPTPEEVDAAKAIAHQSVLRQGVLRIFRWKRRPGVGEGRTTQPTPTNAPTRPMSLLGLNQRAIEPVPPRAKRRNLATPLASQPPYAPTDSRARPEIGDG